MKSETTTGEANHELDIVLDKVLSEILAMDDEEFAKALQESMGRL